MAAARVVVLSLQKHSEDLLTTSYPSQTRLTTDCYERDSAVCTSARDLGESTRHFKANFCPVVRLEHILIERILS